MNGRPTSSAPHASQKLSPWLIILFTAPVPLLLFAFTFYKWYDQRTDFTRVTTQFTQRQNQVIAYDALSVARDVTHLLESAANDVESLAVVPPTEGAYRAFYQAHSAMVTEFDERNRIPTQVRIPLYNTLAFLRPDGDEVLRIEDGKAVKSRPHAECRELELCDRQTRELALKLSPGETRYGNLMRWYRPENTPAPNERESLVVVYRSRTGIVELGLDYRHLKSILFAPTFPYNIRTDLLNAYGNGNYVYINDIHTDFLAHPRYWHVTGIDRNTGKRVEPVITDDDAGTRRLNVKAYKGEKLREYFKRMLTQSFQHKAVDIFRAPNMGGVNRVISVAPILLSRGQFKDTGIYGHVSVGCNVDYFEEPKERFVPYY